MLLIHHRGQGLHGRRIVALVFAVGFLFCDLSLYGQATEGNIVGTVTSPDGSVIPNVSVTVTNDGTHATRNATTNQKGQYAISGLNPGRYTVAAGASGFASFQSAGNVLNSQQTIRVDITLKVGNVSTTVRVSGGAPVIETQMPSISATLTAKQVTDNPMNLLGTASGSGNSGIPSFIVLIPTAHQQSSSGTFSAAGSTEGQAYYNVDGITSNSPLFGVVDSPVMPTLDMVHQLRFNYVNNKAEMGQLFNVTVITKSGTNRFHGDLFEHWSNQTLNALSYFAKSQPSFNNNDYGGSLSGPILKDKLFFMMAFEGSLTETPATVTNNVPTLAMRSGDFSSLLHGSSPIVVTNPYTGQPFPNNVIPPGLISDAALTWQKLMYPEPNSGPPDQFSGNFRGSYPQANYGERYDLRFDANISPSNTAYVRMTYDRASPEEIEGPLPPTPGTGYGIQDRHSYDWVLSDTWILTPNLLNIAKAGGDHTENQYYGVLKGQALLDEMGIHGFPVAPADATGIPTISIASFDTPYQEGPSDYMEQNIQFSDQMTYQHGSHTIKWGFAYWPQQGNYPFNPTFGTFNFDGSLSGFSYADFLLGLPQSTGYTYTRPKAYGRQHFLSAFLQDDWRATSNLTVSYGIRYDYNSAPVDLHDIISSFNPDSGAIVVPSLSDVAKYGTPGFPKAIPIQSAQEAGFPRRSLRSAFKFNLYPRLGFAYSLNKNTVIRGGYGVFSEDLPIDTLQGFYQSPYGGTVGYTNSIVNGAPAITFTHPIDSAGGSLGAISMNSIVLNLRNPFTQQWNLTAERNIGFETSLRLSYIGSKTSDAVYRRDLNQVHVSTVPFSQSNTPYPLYKHTYQALNGGHAEYNAFTAEVNHHLRNNLLFSAALTWSKELSTDPNGASPHLGEIIEDAYDLERQRGNDTTNPRLQFVGQLLWMLPVGPDQRFLHENNLWTKLVGGWQVSANYLAYTGQYLTPSFKGADPSNTNQFSGTPDIVGDPQPTGGRSLEEWFNPNAYEIPKNGTFGNATWGSIEGPGARELNLALFKNFPLPKNSTLQVEGSFTNVLNHPNFGNPDTVVTDRTAGKITKIRKYGFGPRSGLLSVRFQF